jgi:hypothetical protein
MQNRARISGLEDWNIKNDQMWNLFPKVGDK